MFFRLPENFHAAVLLPPALARHADALNHLVDRVVTGQMFRRADFRGFVRLKVAYLRRVIPDRDERRLRRLLISAGVLECDQRYVRGRTSRGYRLAAAYKTRIIRVPCLDPATAARVRRVRRLRTRRGAATRPVDKHLRHWLGQLEIDLPAALGAARRLDEPHLHVALVEEIARGEVEFSRCRQGRVHTGVTRLARSIRPSLRICGLPLCQIDLANAQPLLLGLYMLKRQFGAGSRFPGAQAGVKRGYRQVEPSPDRSVVSGPPSPVFPSTMASSDRENAGQLEQRRGLKVGDLLRHEDRRRYVALCEAGVLYEHLVARCGIRGMTRSRMKKRVMIDVLCGKDVRPTRVSRAFEREFPSVMRVVRRAKRKDHTLLPRALQRLESGLMIDGVCDRLRRERPDVPILTLHDAILTPVLHVEVVQRAIMAELARVGLSPTLKIELTAGAGGGVRAAA